MTANDELAIRNLLARFAEATDRGTIDEYGACLTEAATMEIAGTEPRSGRGAIVAAMEANRAQGLFGPASGSIHVLGATVINLGTHDAQTSTSFLFLAGAPGQKQVVGAGRYDDTLIRASDGWRIAHRRIEIA